MRAWVIDRFGGPEVFFRAERETPAAGPGRVVVRVAASSVNPVDAKIRSGAAGAMSPAFPAVLHSDVSGVVESIGPGVSGFSPGDRVFGCVGGMGPTQGVLADAVSADARLLARAPTKVSLAEAAALPLVGLTVAEGLWKRPVRAGETVLVRGGTGGVGHVAVQMLKAAGARVVATASSDEKRALCVQLGADEAIDHTPEAAAAAAKRLTRGGFDVVFDTVGGSSLEAAFPVTRMNGSVVTIQARGKIDLSAAHGRGLSIHVVFMPVPLLTGEGLERHGEMLRELAGLVDTGRVRPVVHDRRFTFDEVGEAHALLEAGGVVGKIVLVHPEGERR